MWRDLSGARQVTRTIGGLQDETTNPAVGVTPRLPKPGRHHTYLFFT
ncbi:hypothetical protein TIFTF001_044824 [Ficus carica]|uniref:Uncharacterized protein n=1 Tax=Ficus carica TaxID=3494 RepID=A0AA87ZB49_FICCA|nr:hypothetical protein TIFTF001_044824 [Ficus carica]